MKLFRVIALLLLFLFTLASGSVVQLTNRHRFSYPGYAEILLGEPHDDVINTNDPIRNPYHRARSLDGVRIAGNDSAW